MINVAAEQTREGADTLRRAVLLADPYARADAVWEAARRARRAAERLLGPEADRCIEIAFELEECCEAGHPPPSDGLLEHYAECLEAI